MHFSKRTVYPSFMSNPHPNPVHDELVALVSAYAPSAKLFEHPECKTSEESMEARYRVSGERVAGAKALLVKLDVRDQPDVFAVIVLPGFSKLDSKAVKIELKERIVGFRGFRFASPEEMDRTARGMQPGKMPPFGRPLFPDVTYTFIDKALLDHEKVGFNAADFEKSYIVLTKDYMTFVAKDGVFSCSTE